VSKEVRLITFPADWKKFGRSAGPVRNLAQLNCLLEQPGERLVVAFHRNIASSKGTANMVGVARKMGVKVVVLPEGQEE
jgi:hypothetical protein